MLIDGELGDCLPAADRGFHYGDGLFETVAWVEGHPCLWQRHLTRLEEGAVRLGIAPPARDDLLREAQAAAGDLPRAVVKIILTRGSGGRGYSPPPHAQPRRLVAAYPWPSYPETWMSRGIEALWCRTPLGSSPALAGVKHLNRLEQVLGRSEWTDPAIAEGIMCDAGGWMIGGTMTNLFLVSRDQLVTPRIDRCGVAGVMPGLVIDVALGLGIGVVEERLSPQDLAEVDAAFVTNSLIGLWPLRRVGETRLNPNAVPERLKEVLLLQAVAPDAFTKTAESSGEG